MATSTPGAPAGADVLPDGRWVNLPAVRQAFLDAGYLERLPSGPVPRAALMEGPGVEALVPLVAGGDVLLRVDQALRILAGTHPDIADRVDLAVLTRRELVLWRARSETPNVTGAPDSRAGASSR